MHIREQLVKLLEKAKVKKQLYFIYFLALSIPILLIGIFLIVNTQKLLIEHYQAQVESDNLRVKSIIYDTTTTIYNMSDELVREDSLTRLLNTQYDNEREAYNALTQYNKLASYANHASISELTIYTSNDSLSMSTRYFEPLTSEIESTEWFQKALNQMSPFWTTQVTKDSWNNEYLELCLVRQIPIISSDETAVLVLKVNRNNLKNRIDNVSLLTILTINDEPVFFSSDRDLLDEPYPFYIDYSQRIYTNLSDTTYKNQRVLTLVTTQRAYQTDGYFYITTIDTDAYSTIANITNSCLLIILVASVIPFFIILIFTSYFSRRVSSLRQAMHNASSGDYDDIKDTFEGDDELSQTFYDLRVMVQKIKEKEAEIYQEQINQQILMTEQQKMEFKMLASQINPHFLYNTLETIRMQAFTSGNRDVATSIKLLGRSLHYVLENTGTSSTTLQKELDYIETYLAIQKLRFNDRINYTLEVEDGMDLGSYRILPLLLQPVVENAILHGLESREENGQIRIKVETLKNEYLQIHITDNGDGMDEGQLNQLRTRIEKQDITTTTSIGLYNINQRIRLCYGNDYSIKIDSTPGQGTHVTLILPLNSTLEE